MHKVSVYYLYGDWMGIYIDGQLVYDYPPIDLDDFVRLLANKLPDVTLSDLDKLTHWVYNAAFDGEDLPELETDFLGKELREN